MGSCELRRHNLQAGYDALEIGDSRSRVSELMGSPRETEACRDADTRHPCTALYYYVLFERWIIYIDSNGKVVDKINHEGSY